MIGAPPSRTSSLVIVTSSPCSMPAVTSPCSWLLQRESETHEADVPSLGQPHIAHLCRRGASSLAARGLSRTGHRSAPWRTGLQVLQWIGVPAAAERAEQTSSGICLKACLNDLPWRNFPRETGLSQPAAKARMQLPLLTGKLITPLRCGSMAERVNISGFGC